MEGPKFVVKLVQQLFPDERALDIIGFYDAPTAKP